MLIKIGNAFVDPAEIAVITPDREDGLTELEQATQICITLKHGGSFWIDATMDEAEAALIDAGVIDDGSAGIPPELSEEENTILEEVLEQNYNWLVRDGDGKLYAYRKKPEKEGAYWNSSPADVPMRIQNGFNFVLDEDTEPTPVSFLAPWLAK